jgi:hypothetical protein
VQGRSRLPKANAANRPRRRSLGCSNAVTTVLLYLAALRSSFRVTERIIVRWLVTKRAFPHSCGHRHTYDQGCLQVTHSLWTPTPECSVRAVLQEQRSSADSPLECPFCLAEELQLPGSDLRTRQRRDHYRGAFPHRAARRVPFPCRSGRRVSAPSSGQPGLTRRARLPRPGKQAAGPSPPIGGPGTTTRFSRRTRPG